MKVGYVYDPIYLKHDTGGHVENAKRLEAIISHLEETGLKQQLTPIEPRAASIEELSLVHRKEYISHIQDAAQRGGGWLDADTVMSAESYQAAIYAAGGLIRATEAVMDGEVGSAFALVRPPGHHATPRRAMGFCLFNNIAIATKYALTKYKLERIAIIDFDVHHGNGTQDIFYDRKDVMYQSIHLSPHYPGTGSVNEIGIGEGVGYTINAPFPYGCGNTMASRVLDEIFLPVANQFKPDIVIMSCGYDSHHADPLGGLRLTTDFYGEIIKKYQQIQPRIACTLEGGYNLNWIGKCLITQLGQMTDTNIMINDYADEKKDEGTIIKKIKNKIKEYWEL